jgi:hypothetical protein
MDQNNTNMPQQPQPVVAPEIGQAPQNLDKSDAMTYPLGSQATQPEPQEMVEEDHRSILERIMGIFSKGKKETPVQESAPVTNDPTLTDTTPPQSNS